MPKFGWFYIAASTAIILMLFVKLDQAHKGWRMALDQRDRVAADRDSVIKQYEAMRDGWRQTLDTWTPPQRTQRSNNE